jgi:hypothetical protein
MDVSHTDQEPGMPKPIHEPNDGLDVREIVRRWCIGIPQIVAFTLIGVAFAGIIHLLRTPNLPVTTSTRVVFSFKGFEKGEYPDHSKFNPNDLRAPDIIQSALTQIGLGNNLAIQSRVSDALVIEGLIPQEIQKQRERLRGLGQVPPVFYPSEYDVTLTLPDSSGLTPEQRKALLLQIINQFGEKFRRTYVDFPVAYGDALDKLKTADYFEYEVVLNRTLEAISTYLDQKKSEARNFRSPTTNLSYDDLLIEVQLFSQLNVNETFGLILRYGLSKNRDVAMVKIGYSLQVLEDQENRALEVEKMVQELLARAEMRDRGYVLGLKSQAVQPRGAESTIVDQGLVDSLLANDSYNFLIHQAYDAGLALRTIQSQKALLTERQKTLEEFASTDPRSQATKMAQVDASLITLKTAYTHLIDTIRQTDADFAHQQFADSIRSSAPINTEEGIRPLIKATAMGGLFGLFLGLALSSLSIYVRNGRLR